MIRVDNLSISTARGRQLVSNLSFSLAPGECLAIVGPSGSGKSLTAKALMGLLPAGLTAEADSMMLFGNSALELDDRGWQQLRGSKLGLIVQESLSALDPLRRVVDEVAEPLEIHGLAKGKIARAQAFELLETQGIPEAHHKGLQYPHEFSGGQRQRALIASVLAADPQVIIADEPTAALDTALRLEQARLLGDLKARGKSLILISHDFDHLARLADTVVLIDQGVTVETGPAAEVFDTPASQTGQQLQRARVQLRQLKPHPVLATAPEEPVASSDSPVLEARNLTKSYQGRTVLNEVSLSLHRGETLGVIGPSGSGKTTLAQLLLAVEQAENGEVRLSGEPWSTLTESHRRGRRPKIQTVSQDTLAAFNSRWTSAKILDEALRLRFPSSAERKRRATQLLTEVLLPSELLHRHPSQMSGGQRQRLAIARALALEPEILICDEAVSALDVTVQAELVLLFERLATERGLAVLFISHDLMVVRRISDRVIMLHNGRIVKEGPPTELLGSLLEEQN